MSPTGRAFAYGVLGWLVPLVVALPLAAVPEPVGGMKALRVLGAWLLLLGPIGSAVAGWRASRYEPRDMAFWGGLTGCALAVAPVVAIDAFVDVLSIGIGAFIGVLPIAIGYALGFAAGSFIMGGGLGASIKRWRRLSQTSKAIAGALGLVVGLAAMTQALSIISDALHRDPSYSRGDLSAPDSAAGFVKFVDGHDDQTVVLDVWCPSETAEGSCLIEWWPGEDEMLLLWAFAEERCFDSDHDHASEIACVGGTVFFVEDTPGADAFVGSGPGNLLLVRGRFHIRKDAYAHVFPDNIQNFGLTEAPASSRD